MDDLAINNAVQQAYTKKRSDWRNVTVTGVEPAASGGYLAVVEGTEEDEEVEELCFVDQRGKVRVFDTTSELVYYLSTSHSWEKRLFSASAVGAAAFLITLAAVILMTFMNVQNEAGMDALKGLLALAAGFYFGNQSAKS